MENDNRESIKKVMDEGIEWILNDLRPETKRDFDRLLVTYMAHYCGNGEKVKGIRGLLE